MRVSECVLQELFRGKQEAMVFPASCPKKSISYYYYYSRVKAILLQHFSGKSKSGWRIEESCYFALNWLSELAIQKKH